MLLNIDGGEHDDEPEELYALAHVVNVACGGHAGDAASMARVVRACVKNGTRVSAHPSYVDREGFGRRARHVEPKDLETQVRAQCDELRAIAAREGAAVAFVKPHGALYHAADRDEPIARAVVAGAGGEVVIVGPAGGALERAARSAGLGYFVEAFADRGVRADGSLVPRGEPGALIDDPAKAAERTREILRAGAAQTICVHGDTPNALSVARAVRRILDET
jgi:UPF0271 protein